MMRLLLAFFLFLNSLSAQESPASDKASAPRGVTPVGATAWAANTGQTRAVVVGISRYQSEGIPNLNFADKDAEAFALYLQSPAGGSLPPENLQVLTNEKATQAHLGEALDWLVEQSREGDQAIIYFSGHGDVEVKTARQPGFLLCYDSPPNLYMSGGSFPLYFLQLIIETLSVDKNVQTIVITDACRAGKLAGNEIGGAQATAANLAKQYANEIKILSCQPNEFSLEGLQWGGGRGAFSYHLIEGLIGLADRNGNGQVNLLELENYLETVVPAETDPQSQIPMTVGSKGTNIARVDAGVLAKLKDLKARQLPALAAIESRGVEEALLARVDTSVQEKYEAFIAALEHKNLLDGPAGQASADDLYRELMQEESLANLHRFMTRRFATALQDDAQQAINAYLQANPTELEKRWKGDSSYAQYPRYLDRAAELLGNSHYMHDYLLAKKFYFEGLNLRLLADQGNERGSYPQAIGKLEAALVLEDRAAFFYNELGVLYTRLTQSEKAIDYYQKAIELAPEWSLPYVNLCLEQFYNNDTEKALETGDKAIELMPDYPQLYNLLGWISADYGSYWDKRNWKRQGVELRDDFRYNFDNRSSQGQLSKKFQKTIDLLEKAVEIDSTFAAAHYNLGPIYIQVDQYGKAVDHLKKAVLLAPENEFAFVMLGHALEAQSKYAEAEEALKQSIKLAETYTPDRVCLNYNSLGRLYKNWGKADKALEAFQKAIDICPTYGYPYNGIAEIYHSRKDYKNAERYYLKYWEVSSTTPEAYNGLSLFYKSINRFQEAEWMLLKAIELWKDYTVGKTSLISLYQAIGEHEKAMQWQENLLEDAPDDRSVYINTGLSAYLNKQYEKAEAHFQKAVQFDPTNWAVYNNIGYFYRNHSEVEKAKIYLIKAQQLNPPIRYPYTSLAFVQYDTGAIEAGDACLDTMWSKFQDPMAFHFKMYLKLYEENYPAALTQLNLLTAHNKAYEALGPVFLALRDKDFYRADSLIHAIPDSLNNLPAYFQARIHTRLGRFEKAVELLNEQVNLFSYRMTIQDTFFKCLQGRQDYEQLLRKNFPEKFDDLDSFPFTKPQALYYSENCLILGQYYEMQGEPERAKFLYEKAIELKPDTLTDALAMYLAEAYLKLGQLDEARAICPERIESENADDLLAFGKLFYLLGKGKAAEEYFEKYLAMGKNPPPLDRVDLFYKNHGAFDLAEPLAKAAIAQEPGVMSHRRNLARLYFFFDKKQEAYAILEEAKNIRPDDQNTRALIAVLHYFDQPLTANLWFDTLAGSNAALQPLWNCIETIRRDEFEQADRCWEALYTTLPNAFWLEMLKYKYLQMKIRQGEKEKAIQLFSEILQKGWFVNYQLFGKDPALDPLRDLDKFRELMLRYFPEKTEDR